MKLLCIRVCIKLIEILLVAFKTLSVKFESLAGFGVRLLERGDTFSDLVDAGFVVVSLVETSFFDVPVHLSLTSDFLVALFTVNLSSNHDLQSLLYLISKVSLHLPVFLVIE